MAVFNVSLQKGCCPEVLKIARATPIYKVDDVNEIPYRTKQSRTKVTKFLGGD